MNVTTYAINPLSGLVNHFAGPLGYVCDADVSDTQQRRMEIDAQVRSGDYFITLATRLDALAQEGVLNNDTAYEMQRLVGDLLYLQHNYEIKRK